MRFILILTLLPLPAFAWEFSPDPICTLSHQTGDAEIIVTYDASLPEYAVHITRQNGTWDAAPSFRMAFGGGREVEIGTTRHSLSTDGTTLSVRDRGFGNVLDGLEFNENVVSTSGGTSVIANLTDAAPAVQAFRACPTEPPATS